MAISARLIASLIGHGVPALYRNMLRGLRIIPALAVAGGLSLGLAACNGEEGGEAVEEPPVQEETTETPAQ